MPLRLPPVLLIRRLAQQCLFALIFALRAIVVGIVWLALLPWATVWTWRMYFTMGDSTYVFIFGCLVNFLLTCSKGHGGSVIGHDHLRQKQVTPLSINTTISQPLVLTIRPRHL